MYKLQYSDMDKIELVEKQVLRHFPVAAAAPEMLMDKTRKAEYRFPRHIIWYVAASLFSVRYVRLAERYNRKHSTVMRSIQKLSDAMEVDKKLNEKINEITLELI